MQIFQKFLGETKSDLNIFYKSLSEQKAFESEEKFEIARQIKVKEIAEKYDKVKKQLSQTKSSLSTTMAENKNLNEKLNTLQQQTHKNIVS